MTEGCQQFYQNDTKNLDGVSCPAAWDKLLCWPPTRAGETATLPCPPLNGIDTTKFAVRKCSESGQWEGDPTSGSQLEGWTNYSDCYLPEMKDLMDKLNSESGEVKMFIAYSTRILEFTGLSLSLLSIIISFIIFQYFRSLQNQRTRIHKNLFAAIAVQVIIRLILYTDQAIHSQLDGQVTEPLIENGIHRTKLLCESFYIVLEYTKTAVFVWMFIEGLYLHNLITVMVFRPDTYHIFYLVGGWGVPVVLTTIWAAFTATQPKTSNCWWGYSFKPSYWILEGPRSAIILVNLIYLLNIIRVLVTKLRDSRCTEAEQLRKAVKAAIVLLPLLGITNAVVMVEGPLDKSVLEFALWSYISHFLTSFQGFLVSLIYCFLNGEVRQALLKRLDNYVMDHEWASNLLGNRLRSYSTHTETDAFDREKGSRIALRTLRDNVESNGFTTAADV